MTWTPPASAITWQDFPNLSTAVSAAHLNQAEGYSVTVGQSVVDYVSGASAHLVPSGGDDSAAMVTALTSFAPFASPMIVMGPGTFLWNTSVPALLRATPARIVGAGIGQTIVKGSASAPRFLDLPYVADFDTYSNITIEGITFDRQNLTQATNTHILIGDLPAGAWSLRANFSNITVRGCQTLNVPTGTPGNGGPNYHSVSLVSRQVNTTIAVGSNGLTLPQSTINVASTSGFPAAGTLSIGGSIVTYTGTTGTTFTGCTGGAGTMTTGEIVMEGTQASLRHILVVDCDFANGGNVGVSVMGSGATPVNVKYDDVKLIRVRHDTLNTPTAFHADANFQVGGTGFGGSVYMEECYGAGSGDVGTELDDPITSTMVRCQMVDAWNAGFFPNNFGGQTDVNGQTFTFRDCLSQKINLGTGATNSNGFRLGGNGSTNGLLGRVVLEDCQHENFSQSLVAGDALAMWPVNPTGGYKSITIRGLQVSISGWNQNVSVLSRFPAVQTAAPSGTTLIEHISGLDVNFNVTRGGGSSASLFLYALGCRGTGTILHNVDGVTASLGQANAVGTSTQFIGIGMDADAGIHRGAFRRVGPHAAPGDTAPVGFRFGPGNVYALLAVMDSDLSGSNAGSEFSFATAGDSAKVRCARVRRRNGVVPAPTTLTGLVTATGKALGTVHACTVQFTQGSGAGITAIDFSSDGGTTYINALTQAAGAMPAGADLILGPLTTDSLIKVTFTTTQPTVNLVPFEP